MFWAAIFQGIVEKAGDGLILVPSELHDQCRDTHEVAYIGDRRSFSLLCAMDECRVTHRRGKSAICLVGHYSISYIKLGVFVAMGVFQECRQPTGCPVGRI